MESLIVRSGVPLPLFGRRGLQTVLLESRLALCLSPQLRRTSKVNSPLLAPFPSPSFPSSLGPWAAGWLMETAYGTSSFVVCFGRLVAPLALRWLCPWVIAHC
jgi:hypothetical protein